MRTWTFIRQSLTTLALAAALGARAGAAPGGEADGGWEQWKAKRRESIGGSNGWSTVVGLAWLPEGNSSIGSDPTNQIVLPGRRGPGAGGVISRTGDGVSFVAAPTARAWLDGREITQCSLRSDAEGPPSRLRLGPVELTLIQRGARLGLRMRDPEAPARKRFRGLEYFPYEGRWRVEARFERDATGTNSMRIIDVTGVGKDEPVAGTLVFNHQGTQARLVALEDKETDDLFLIFRDATSGRSTYPTGRFLHALKPDAAGRVMIDFNRAYNPPCAFTPFATCPLPPRTNWLSFAIEAGEKAFHSHP
jgi:hypothetical protein